MGLFPAKIRLLSKISKLLSKIIIQNMKCEYSRQRPDDRFGINKNRRVVRLCIINSSVVLLFLYYPCSLCSFQSFIPFDIHMKMK